ncbi:MAG TPA: DUF3617 family protein [Vicinamibacterales bacterium]
MKTTLTVVLALLALGTAGLIAQGGMRPGRWETTMQMEMAGSPVQMPPMKQTRCVTPAEAKDPASLQSGPPGGRGGKNDCKVSDQKMSGNTMSWKITCTSPDAMTGTGEMTFADDSYTGTMKMNMAQGAMSMKMEGKRLGDCTN